MGWMNYKDTFGRKLYRMYRLFELVEKEVTVTGTFNQLILPDPRRVVIAIFAFQTDFSNFQFRITGSTSVNGYTFANNPDNLLIWNISEHFAFVQKGIELKSTGGDLVVGIHESIYTGS